MRLAIVEDDKSAADELRALLRGYEKEHGEILVEEQL